MSRVKEYAESLSRRGYVCNGYMRRIEYADTVGDIYRIMCDVNGGERLLELHSRGVLMPLSAVESEMGRYVNGGMTETYPEGYTSKFYCMYRGNIEADSTVLFILESDVSVHVPENCYPRIFVSSGSVASIDVTDCYRAEVEIFGDAEVEITGDGKEKARIKRRILG